MSIWFALSPILVLSVGVLGLMLADSFSKTRTDLAMGSFITFLSAGLFAIALWIVTIGGVWSGAACFVLFSTAMPVISVIIVAILGFRYLPGP